MSKYWHILQTQGEIEERIREWRLGLRERERDRAMEAVVATKLGIKVAALCGSLSKGSYNRGLVHSGTFFAFVFSVSCFVFGS